MVVALSPKEQKSDIVNNAIREAQMGRDNACGTVTLAVSAGTTTVAWPNCSVTSKVFLQPTTADAAAAYATTWISSVSKGQFVITHANNAIADRTFFFTVRGGN